MSNDKCFHSINVIKGYFPPSWVSIEFIWYRMLQCSHCTVSFTRHQSTKVCQAFLDILLGCVDIGI